MITLIIESYFKIFIGVGLFTIVLLTIGLYCIIKIAHENQRLQSSKERMRPDAQTSKENSGEANNIADLVALTRPSNMVNLDDVVAIAGDDIVTTQLDLAKAYIESGKRDAAIGILNTVIAQGNNTQQAEAKKLLRA